MSKAIVAGLYHPRCKDSHTTYFEGISSKPNDKYTKEEIKEIEQRYELEQKRLYAKRQAEKCKRLADNSLDESERKKYRERQKHWENAEYLRNNLPKKFRDERKVGELISREELKRFLSEAERRGIQIGTIDYPTGGFEYYRGQPEVLYEILDNLENSIAFAKKNKLYRGKVILKYDNVLGYNGDNSMVDVDAFAMTSGRTITLNKFMFDDSDYLKKCYADAVKNRMFTQGTDYRNVINHEFGHIIDKNNKNLKEKILNVLRKDAESAKMSLEVYVRTHISEYAIERDKYGNLIYQELISELEAMNNGTQREVAKDVWERLV